MLAKDPNEGFLERAAAEMVCLFSWSVPLCAFKKEVLSSIDSMIVLIHCHIGISKESDVYVSTSKEDVN